MCVHWSTQALILAPSTYLVKVKSSNLLNCTKLYNSRLWDCLMQALNGMQHVSSVHLSTLTSPTLYYAWSTGMHTSLAGFLEKNSSPTEGDERFGLLSSFLFLKFSFVSKIRCTEFIHPTDVGREDQHAICRICSHQPTPRCGAFITFDQHKYPGMPTGTGPSGKSLSDLCGDIF